MAQLGVIIIIIIIIIMPCGDDQIHAMNAKLKRLTARVKSLSVRMQCIDEGNAKIKKFISQSKTNIIRMESVSSAAEKSLDVLVSNLGKR
jgi:predicted  nucleic acid-binding Zn-ribbon protein